MSFRKIISAIAAACVLTGSVALGTTDSFAATAKPHAHKELVCKPGLVAHPVKVDGKTVWKCGKVHHAKKPATKKAVKAKPAATHKHKTHPKKTHQLVCKKGSTAKKVKKHGKWVWECFKVKPAKK
jgi:hypothetical protein